MTGFDIVDRYDIALSLVMGALVAGALFSGAPLWVSVLIVFVTCLIGFVRHFEETMGGCDDAKPT